ncbi:MAG: hypothetical protein ABW211_03970, partial [Acidimicrobiia bacterium]
MTMAESRHLSFATDSDGSLVVVPFDAHRSVALCMQPIGVWVLHGELEPVLLEWDLLFKPNA